MQAPTPTPSPASAARKPRRWPVTLVALAITAALVGGGYYLVKQQGGAPAGARGAGPGGPGRPRGMGPGMGPGMGSVTVGIATAQRGELPIVIDALGTVVPSQSVALTAQVGGVLQEVLFEEGQMVKKGQLLARIDARTYEQTLAQSKSQTARDRAQLASAEQTLKRYETLWQQDSIARQEVDTQAALVQQLRATVNSNLASERSAQINLDHTRISAPISGRIGLRSIDPGNLVSAGSTTIATITQITPVDVSFSVPQDRVGEVMAAQQAGPLTVKALDRARSATLATGLFLTVDNAVDTATGTVKAKARFDNTDFKLFPNQFVNVNLQLGGTPGVLVPVSAVRLGPNGAYVYVVDDAQVARMRTVTRGAATNEQVLITDGLQGGERVITEGGDRVKEGNRVQLAGERPMAGASGARGMRGEGGPRGPRGPRSEGAPPAPAQAAPGSAPSDHATPPASNNRTPSTGAAPTAESGANRMAQPAQPMRAADRTPASAETSADNSISMQSFPPENRREQHHTASNGEQSPAMADRPAGERGGPGARQLPPELAEKLAGMTPEERAAFMAERRAARQAQRAAEGQDAPVR